MPRNKVLIICLTLLSLLTIGCDKLPEEKLAVEIGPDEPVVFTFDRTVPDPSDTDASDGIDTITIGKNWFSVRTRLVNNSTETFTFVLIEIEVQDIYGNTLGSAVLDPVEDNIAATPIVLEPNECYNFTTPAALSSSACALADANETYISGIANPDGGFGRYKVVYKVKGYKGSYDNNTLERPLYKEFSFLTGAFIPDTDEE